MRRPLPLLLILALVGAGLGVAALVEPRPAEAVFPDPPFHIPLSPALPDPPDPTPHVQPNPGGGIGFLRLLLVKPDGTFDELLEGFLCDG